MAVGWSASETWCAGTCRALYGMLLHPDLARSNKTGMFLSLLYKAMKADISNHRILAFIKRLLQVFATVLMQNLHLSPSGWGGFEGGVCVVVSLVSGPCKLSFERLKKCGISGVPLPLKNAPCIILQHCFNSHNSVSMASFCG